MATRSASPMTLGGKKRMDTLPKRSATSFEIETPLAGSPSSSNVWSSTVTLTAWCIRFSESYRKSENPPCDCPGRAAVTGCTPARSNGVSTAWPELRKSSRLTPAFPRELIGASLGVQRTSRRQVLQPFPIREKAHNRVPTSRRWGQRQSPVEAGLLLSPSATEEGDFTSAGSWRPQARADGRAQGAQKLRYRGRRA